MNVVKFLVRQCGASALTDPEVASALDVSETQRLRIEDVVRRNTPTWRERIRSLFIARPREEPVQKTLRKVRHQLDRPITALLNETQRRKLAGLQGQESQSLG